MTNVWLGVCVSAVLSVTATRAEAQSNQVAGFKPSTNGLQFNNFWPAEPDWTISVAGFNVPIGNASQGLCGGMVYTVRDYWESGMHVPLTTRNPVDGTPLFNYIAYRLLDSFTPNNVARTYTLQASPFDSDRQGTMANEWPRIKADIDAGILSPVGLIRLRWNVDPTALGNNHQVLAYGYDVLGSLVTLHIYDPNHPQDNTVVVTLNLATAIVTQSTGEQLFSFFREDYAPKQPLATQTWQNGFEGPDAGLWWPAGSAGTAANGYAETGAGYGWVEATTGWNAINTWVPLVPNHVCTMRADVQTITPAAINAYMTMRSYPDNHIFNEAHITIPDGDYASYTVDFVADSSWGLFYVGLWGTGADSWLRTDDAIVVCQTW